MDTYIQLLLLGVDFSLVRVLGVLQLLLQLRDLGGEQFALLHGGQVLRGLLLQQHHLLVLALELRGQVGNVVLQRLLGLDGVLGLAELVLELPDHQVLLLQLVLQL